jgi:uncharacterized protein involved in tolerance to divalent cations
LEKWKRLPLDEAKKIAKVWVDRLKTCCCELVDVTGSVYNESKNPVGDIDITCLIKDRQALQSLNPTKEDAIRTVYTDAQGHKIEIWRVEDPEKYELIRWYRRKSKGDFIRLASVAKSKGMTLSWQRGLVDQEGKVITVSPNKIEQMLEG